MKKYIERLWNGLIKENPVLVLMLGMCPALAVSTQASNGIGMGLSTLAVLVLSNLVISCLRKVIPDQVRLPAYIVIVASLVTVTELLIKAYLPDVYEALGIYIPLIVGELHHPRPGGSLRQQAYSAAVRDGRYRHGPGLHDGPDPGGYDP